ncbi:MAG: 1,4-alpha-glucan branching protein, partial [Tunicatimonas sp.]
MNTAEKLAGMGAIVTSEGVGFRVWAPNAQAVRVTGSFCDWNEEGPTLEAEEDGYWYTFVSEVQAGDEYKFLIKSPHDDWLYRNDPYSRQLTNSDGNSIIYDPTHFDWQEDSFELPPWNQCIIYEMHIGTFHVKEE